MQLCDETDEVLERFKMEFLNESRTCLLKKEVPKLTIGGIEIGPLQSGVQVDLPNWVIEILQEAGIAELLPAEAYESTRRLSNLHRMEMKDHELQTFHPLLYAAVSRKILKLQRDKTSIDPISLEETERLQSMMDALVEIRRSKVVRAAVARAYTEKRKKMTNEERWLCERLADLLSSWREKVLD
ncbi:MAG: hypothetical protein JSW61_00275 [Candidatus Thorarchaeota archaeon]|nr:MAG: hypothetical protein JSW61_00275 [Candidatus Thorarchaeota archaeon]